MLIYNKYLKELGYKKSDFPFKKEDDRYNLDKEYGVVEAQTWNLNNTIILELYTYLRNFQERFMHYGTPICFVEKFENGKVKHIDGGEKDWHNIIQQIIDGLKAYLTAQEKFQFASSDEDRAEQDRLYKQFEEAWKLLGDNIGYLWW